MAPTRTRKKAPARKKAAARKRAASPRKASSSSTRQVSDSHKKAMQAGRVEGAAIRRYLEALRIEKGPKRRGRRRTPETMTARIAVIDAMIRDGVDDPLAEVQMRQEKLLLTNELQRATEPTARSEEFRADFVKAVKPYSERKGISYDVWRELGVPVIVLREAGMTPSRA